MLFARSARTGIVAAYLGHGPAVLLHRCGVMVPVVAVGPMNMAMMMVVVIMVVVAVWPVNVLGGDWLTVGSVGGHGTGSLIETSISSEP